MDSAPIPEGPSEEAVDDREDNLETKSALPVVVETNSKSEEQPKTISMKPLKRYVVRLADEKCLRTNLYSHLNQLTKILLKP